MQFAITQRQGRVRRSCAPLYDALTAPPMQSIILFLSQGCPWASCTTDNCIFASHAPLLLGPSHLCRAGALGQIRQVLALHSGQHLSVGLRQSCLQYNMVLLSQVIGLHVC